MYIYECVTYKDKEYAVITIQHKHNSVQFVIDNCNLTQVMTKPWHLSSGKYIATHYTLPTGKTKEVHLHHFIKEHCMKDTTDNVIVHINNNMFDNRVENLRIIESSEYFPSRRNRKRTVTLPPDSGFVIDELPKYLTYIKANGEHGDRFVIEIPRLALCVKLSSSKKIPLKDKFEEAKKMLDEIYTTYPDINPHTDDALKVELNGSLEAILNSTSM